MDVFVFAVNDGFGSEIYWVDVKRVHLRVRPKKMVQCNIITPLLKDVSKTSTHFNPFY